MPAIAQTRSPAPFSRPGRTCPAGPDSLSRVLETPAYDLSCIGSGPAGQRGAVQAAKIGQREADVIDEQLARNDVEMTPA